MGQFLPSELYMKCCQLNMSSTMSLTVYVLILKKTFAATHSLNLFSTEPQLNLRSSRVYCAIFLEQIDNWRRQHNGPAADNCKSLGNNLTNVNKIPFLRRYSIMAGPPRPPWAPSGPKLLCMVGNDYFLVFKRKTEL